VLDDDRIVVSIGAVAREVGGDDGADVHPRFLDPCITWPEGDPRPIERALRLVLGDPRPMSEAELDRARAEVEACLARDWVLRSCGAGPPSPALRRAVRRQLDATLRSMKRHARARALAMASRLRALLDQPMPLGTERALFEHASRLGSAGPGGEEWILEALALLGGSSGSARAGAVQRGQPTAIIVMGPE
jgi:hypothetical protein